jgi:hypothetical protein
LCEPRSRWNNHPDGRKNYQSCFQSSHETHFARVSCLFCPGLRSADSQFTSAKR